MMKNLLVIPALMLLFVGASYAADSQPLLDKNKVSIAGGIANNSVGHNVDDELGVQFFGAYDLTQVRLIESVDTSVELGYMDYGFSGKDSGGLWVNAVVDGAFNQSYGWLARLGLDLGDDSGLMFGAGISYAFDVRTQLRGEYVIRDDIDSLQLNIIYHL
jgi:hypothetical protein